MEVYEDTLSNHLRFPPIPSSYIQIKCKPSSVWHSVDSILQAFMRNVLRKMRSMGINVQFLGINLTSLNLTLIRSERHERLR